MRIYTDWQARMKTTSRTDTRALKGKHRLERVMEESGEIFEVDPKRPDLWRSKTTPGLSVDLRRQAFELRKPGVDPQTGDVFTWLQVRYAWPFGAALRYLEHRQADPDTDNSPATEATAGEPIRDQQVRTEGLDPLQQRAIEIGGERIEELCTWSLFELVTNIDVTRVVPVVAPGIEECARCENQFNWRAEKSPERDPTGNFRMRTPPIAIRAYLITRDEDDHEVEEDEVVCPRCAQEEIDFQVAIRLLKTSAGRREDEESMSRAEMETKRVATALKKRERERIAVEEAAQDSWECEYPDRIAAERRGEREHETEKL